MNVLEAHGLTKAYKGKRAVDGLDMRVAAGDIYGFVGKNGAGKSTTMKMACGLATPTAGEVTLFGGEPGARPGEFSRVGALIESPGVLPALSAFDNVMAKALALGVVRAREQASELIELVGLADAGKKRVKGFSLGMKQRLGVALALVGSPDLLLLDEPFNGLDPEATRNLRSALVRLNQERGVTVVISSHVLDQLMRVANRFGVIREGHMVRELTEDEVHAECGSSVRVRTTDTARALAILEDALPGAAFRAEPDGSVAVGGSSAEAVSGVLHDWGAQVLELSTIERDVEDFFVELMEGGVAAGGVGGAPASGRAAGTSGTAGAR